MVTVSPGKHRRFDDELPSAPDGMPFSSADYLPSPVDVADPVADANAMWGPGPGETLTPAGGYPALADPDWPPDLGGSGSWPQWDGPPPELHPDHPSAPVPRVRTPQTPVRRAPGPAGAGRVPAGNPGPPGAQAQHMPPDGPPRLPQRRPGGPNPARTIAPRGNAPAQDYGPAQGYDPAQGYGPGPAYNSGPYPAQSGPYPVQSGPYPAQPGPYPAQPGPYPVQSGPYPGQVNPPAQGYDPGPGYNSGPYPAQPGRPAPGNPAVRGNPAARGAGPGNPAARGNPAPRAAGPALGNAVARAARPDHGYGPGQGYEASPGYGPGQSYGPAQGYALATDYDPEPAYLPTEHDRGARGNRRLYAVPDDPNAIGFARQQPDFTDGGPVADGPWDQTTAIRRAAEQEAAAIRQQATEQADAIRQAAEQEAIQMRAALLAMSEELSRVASYVNENLGSPGGLATMPAPVIAPSRPVQPALAPAGPATAPPRPAGPATRPGRPVRPAGPGARPAGRPGKSTTGPTTNTKGRQARAGKKMFAVMAALVTAGAITATAQIALHGGSFFIFRENGAGASETGPTDTQFPGHPGAPAPPKAASDQSGN